MKRSALLAAVLTVVSLIVSLPALAQSPSGMRLYVFSSGSLGGFPKGALQIGGPGNINWAPVGFYGIKPSKRNVKFHTGKKETTCTNATGSWVAPANGFGAK